LRGAVGVVEDGAVQFVGGPVEAVKAKTKTYITIAPGDVTGKEFLKQVLRALAFKLPKEKRDFVGKASVEEIRELVPYTKGRLAENG